MLPERTGHLLDQWLTAVEVSHLPELASFARGIHQDKQAVLAGLTLVWSNGPTEGHINRLKLIKRSVYGRAKLHVIRNTSASFSTIRMIRWKGKVFRSGNHSLGVLSLCL